MLADFIIVGTGIVGYATAYELASQGAKVSLIEGRKTRMSASWASAGILCPLLPWDYPDAVTRLTDWGAKLYPAWVEELNSATGADPQYRVSGMVILPDYDAVRAVQWGKKRHVPVSETAAQNLIESALPQSALWLPHVAQIRSPRLLQALRQWMERHSIAIHDETEVLNLQHKGAQTVGLSTTKGTLQAGNYILAAGAWNQTLLKEKALQLDIKPIRGQIILLDGKKCTLDKILVQGGCYLVPRGDGLILAGSTAEDVGFDSNTTPEAKRDLLQWAGSRLPCLASAAVLDHWAGLRPGSPDNIPVIARHPELVNLYINGGHYRYGMTMAPACAKWLTHLILGRPQPFDGAAYRWPTGASC